MLYGVSKFFKDMQHGGRAKIPLSSCPNAITKELLVLDMGISQVG